MDELAKLSKHRDAVQERITLVLKKIYGDDDGDDEDE